MTVAQAYVHVHYKSSRLRHLTLLSAVFHAVLPVSLNQHLTVVLCGANLLSVNSLYVAVWAVSTVNIVTPPETVKRELWYTIVLIVADCNSHSV